jgi:predicted PurR-regulated permease PerM
VRERLTHELASLVPKAVPLAVDALAAVSAILFVLVLGLFVAAEPDSYERALVRLVPRERRPIANETLRRVHDTVRHWMVGILASMLLMGTFTAIGLYIAGVHGWLALGVLTFFGTFVPYLGALASAIPGLLVALAESPIRFLWALLVYLAVHVLEGYIVQPLIMKRAVSLRPGVLIVWQLWMGGVFGVMGIVVATPLLACVKVAVQYLWIERTLGENA